MQDSTEFGREDRRCCFGTAILDRSLGIGIAAPRTFIVVNAELDVFVSVSRTACSWLVGAWYDVKLK